jgi:hypothetical protein
MPEVTAGSRQGYGSVRAGAGCVLACGFLAVARELVCMREGLVGIFGTSVSTLFNAPRRSRL